MRWTARKRHLLLIGLGLLALWLGSSAAVAWRLSRRSAPPYPEPTPAVSWARIEAHRLATRDGEQIGAWLARGDKPTAVILLHGNGDSRRSGLPLFQFLCERGYSVLAISLRAHGDSTGQTNDVGYSARHDVAAAVAFLERELPGKRIAVAGQSLGAAAAIFSADDCAGRVRGYFLESPYYDLKTAVWNRCDNYLYPPFSHAAYAGLRLWGPVFLTPPADAICPADHIGRIPADVPVVILGSAADRHARAEEARALWQKVASHGELVILPDGRHGQLFAAHREECGKALLDLLGRVDSGGRTGR